MMRAIYRLSLRITGWTIRGNFPGELKKYVVAVGPHTSNWDFLLAVAARSVLLMENAKYMGKHVLFKPPYGWIFRALGGIPVDRTKHTNMVDQMAEEFRKRESLILALAPEGTRKKVKKLKTGFYYIAKAAEVPIVCAGFDYVKREIVIGNPFYPTENVEDDIIEISKFFSALRGRNPELAL